MRRRRAFTMIELMMTVTIMGIIAALIIKASVGGIRRAEEKATIGLIAKLEAALTDRVDALQNNHPSPTDAHKWLSATFTSKSTNPIFSTQRAQVWAFYDELRAQLPDVFVVQNNSISVGATPGTYPLNFAGWPLPSTLMTVLQKLATAQNLNITYDKNALPLGASNSPGSAFPITGYLGASFDAAAGIYQQLGYAPAGYNGADDDNNGFVDDASEAVLGIPAGEQQNHINQINLRLQNHTHKTARAEMLYAVLVHGTGPMGSSFTADELAKTEVADTDNDGLMEFVDAWGEPLQFYRWPVLYHSDTQRGFPDLNQITYCQQTTVNAPIGPYNSSFETREVNTLDPNQLLLSPAWWTHKYNDNYANNIGVAGDPTSNASGGALAFQQFFHTLVDPLAAQTGTSGLASANAAVNTYWDRSQIANANYGALFARRAYYNRFLVLSAGPDKIPGTAQLDVDYTANGADERSEFPLAGGSLTGTRDGTGAMVRVLSSAAVLAERVIQIENQAGRVDPNRSQPIPHVFFGPAMPGGRNDTNTFLEDVGNDDISSQNIHALGGPLQ